MNLVTQVPRRPCNDSLIDSALLDLMADGQPITHDAVAALSGVSRRTIYRRFADQKALRQRVWQLLSPPQAFSYSLEELLDHGLKRQLAGFDENTAAMTVSMASAEGRAMRNTVTAQRVAYYRGLFDTELAALPEPLRTEVIAALQTLCSGFAWREGHDQWGLDGESVARGCVWVIRAAIAAAKAAV